MTPTGVLKMETELLEMLRRSDRPMSAQALWREAILRKAFSGKAFTTTDIRKATAGLLSKHLVTRDKHGRFAPAIAEAKPNT